MPVRTTSADPIFEETEGRPGGSFRDRDAQESQHKYIRDTYAEIWLPAGDFHPIAGSANVTFNHAGNMGAWILPDAGPAGFEGVWLSLRRPKNWINGKIQMDRAHSQNVGSTNVLRIRSRVSSWAVGDTLAGTFDRLDDDEDVAGNAVAGKLYEIQKTTTVITDADDYFGISVERNPAHGNDNHAGNLRFHGMLLTYLPTNRQ